MFQRELRKASSYKKKLSKQHARLVGSREAEGDRDTQRRGIEGERKQIG